MSNKLPKGDRLNATYRHEFYQEQRTSPFVGYSKMLGHAEAKDKEHLLEQYISRMLKNGYLDRSYCMNFYTNNQQGNGLDELLVSITPFQFQIHGAAQLFPHLKDMLQKFFANKNDPTKQQQYLASRKRSGSQVEPFYDFKLTFTSEQALIDHCNEVIRRFGEDQRPRLKGWYWKMREINNFVNA
ncbi:hypothetical protein LV89_02023 [Arcicella aurantiaca]|uniref:Uncharacterized protein n=1 Tax=Arcicella aurantiaca TaxID=591202 RepID=A0A316EC83_9BACT|nr:hypothetical protein [Arcicella aurantiaca]PWK27208.1 hypothetical protein LV89_02023 [Arcicella aurantiaca]